MKRDAARRFSLIYIQQTRALYLYGILESSSSLSLVFLLPLASFNLQLKFFRKMIAACVPYYGQQVLPHSNLLDPHLRSQFACFFVYARRKAQFSDLFPFSRQLFFHYPVRLVVCFFDLRRFLSDLSDLSTTFNYNLYLYYTSVEVLLRIVARLCARAATSIC